MRSTPQSVTGHVDHVGGGLVRGWAADFAAPKRRVMLDVFHRGVFLGCAWAGNPRDDLRAQGIGDGAYGFVFHDRSFHSENRTGGVEIIATDDARTRLILPGDCEPVTPTTGTTQHGASIRAFFRPMIEALAAATTVRFDKTPEGRLFAEDHRAGSSAFAAHIAAKYERPRPAADADFWLWYLGVYGVERADRVPLSAEDIGRLRNMHLVGRDDDGGGLCRWLGRSARDFDWAVHHSRRLRVEDCLVDDATAQRLQRVPWLATRRAYPLSRFMCMIRARHPILRSCPVSSVFDRVVFYVVLMLMALREAHYLRYMPARWVDRILAETPDGSPFEQAQRRLFDGSTPTLSPACYRGHLRGLGFELDTRRFTTLSDHGNRLPATVRSAAERRVDVQMVGPFHQSLGLAESCRRIARALQASGLSINLVDYPIGTTARRAAPEIETGPLCTAEIDILHLNAEEVPEAVAYRLGGAIGTRRILIPYWEMDRPAAAHRLGLALVDEVWCASRFLADVFAGPKPVVHVGMSFDDDVAPVPSKADAGAFGILVVADAFSWARRKNVRGAIAAFQAAFPDDPAAHLTIKTRNVAAALAGTEAGAWRQILAMCAADRRITLVDAELKAAEQKALLARADCLLSLHRAEGLGLDVLDALSLGVPVVATAYSGNTDVCRAETAWLVDCDIVPVEAGHYAFAEPGQSWAEPRQASAVAALREVRRDQATRARKVAAARALVLAEASPAALAERLAGLLRTRLAAGRNLPRAEQSADQFVSGSILPR